MSNGIVELKGTVQSVRLQDKTVRIHGHVALVNCNFKRCVVLYGDKDNYTIYGSTCLMDCPHKRVEATQ